MSQPTRDRRPSRTAVPPVRRRGEHRWRRFVRQGKERWQRALAWDPVWIVVFLLAGTWVLAPQGSGWGPQQVEEGRIAARDFVAPRDALIADRETTDVKRQRAREDVLPVYDFDPAAAERLSVELAKAFALGRQYLAQQRGEEASDLDHAESLLPALREATSLRLDLAPVRMLVEREFAPALEEQVRGLVEQVLLRGVVAGKTTLLENRSRGIRLRNLRTGSETRQLDLYGYLAYPEEVTEALAGELRSWAELTAGQRTTLLDFLVANLGPNLHLNQSETLRRQEVAAAAVEQVYTRVRKGQVVVRKGDQVDVQAARIIGQMTGDQGFLAKILPVLGIFLFLALLALVLWLGLRKERMAQTRRDTVLGEVLALLLVSIVGAKLCHLLATGLANAAMAAPFNQAGSYFYAIPFASLALVTVLLYGRGLALLLALTYSLLAGLVLEEPGWSMIVYSIAGSMAAILAVDAFHFKQRSLTVRAGGVVGLVNVVTVMMLTAITGLEGGGAQLGLDLLSALVGGILVAAVASFVVPVVESLFSITTGIKLVELANTNLPLLRRLAFEAPGTFQHSLMVANLAKTGCEAIGADSVLAYTGALYHDVGKVFRPDYFVENQRGGQNRHDKLLPSMSALILINHVKEGLELAREHHLPEPILDAIAEHHGTRLITYFFTKAKDLNDPESGEVSEEKFRYPGPKPHNKVMGVLMLADGVEAASRTLEDPSPAKIRGLVKAITDDCLRDGQLDETDLTLGDLNKISEAFQHVLSHIHHRRVDYPGFDFNRQGRPPAATESGTLRLEEPEEVAALPATVTRQLHG